MGKIKTIAFLSLAVASVVFVTTAPTSVVCATALIITNIALCKLGKFASYGGIFLGKNIKTKRNGIVVCVGHALINAAMLHKIFIAGVFGVPGTLVLGSIAIGCLIRNVSQIRSRG